MENWEYIEAMRVYRHKGTGKLISQSMAEDHPHNPFWGLTENMIEKRLDKLFERLPSEQRKEK